MNPRDLRRRLLAAFSIPCLIFAALLAWQAYASLTGKGAPLPPWQSHLYIVIATLLMTLFFAGLRARHRPNDPEP